MSSIAATRPSGWLALLVGKRVLKKKAKDAVPSIDTETKKPNKSAIALLVAGTLGALTFWKKRSGGGDDRRLTT